MKPEKPEKKDKKKKGKKANAAPSQEAAVDGMARAASVIGGRWKLRILWALTQGSQRYSAVKRQVGGITDVMLSQSLKELASDGLVERQTSGVESVRITYTLTSRGQSLIPALSLLRDWGETLETT